MKRILAALLAWVFYAPVLALPLPVPYETIVGAPGNQSLGTTWNALPLPSFVYSNPAFNPIMYGFGVVHDQAGNPFGPPVPDAAQNILKNDVLPTWTGINRFGESGQGRQVMDPSLGAGERARHVSAGEVNAYQAVYPVLNPNGVSYGPWQQVGQVLNIVFAFADFGNQAVQNYLALTDWPGKQIDANGNFPSWSERSMGLQIQNGLIVGGPIGPDGPGDIPIDGVLGVWVPDMTCTDQANQNVFCPHDSGLDIIFFNSKVNWYYGNQNPGGNQIDFYHVALHETGHDLGFDHVPEPSTILLILIALPLMMLLRLHAADNKKQSQHP